MREWDFVVLQEQSQVPSIPHMQNSFIASGTKLHDVIKASGAKTMFFNTWGRRDGDKANKTLNPDFETMQKRLDTSYGELGRQVNATVVPIGGAFARVKADSPELFKKLYASDGSHPSAYGAMLAGAVFYQVLTGEKQLPVVMGLRGVDLKDVEALRQSAMLSK